MTTVDTGVEYDEDGNPAEDDFGKEYEEDLIELAALKKAADDATAEFKTHQVDMLKRLRARGLRAVPYVDPRGVTMEMIVVGGSTTTFDLEGFRKSGPPGSIQRKLATQLTKKSTDMDALKEALGHPQLKVILEPFVTRKPKSEHVRFNDPTDKGRKPEEED